ncbi:hypothetical protein NSK_005283 [Nannochloropsis salina CCMP1776]|uniref:TLC domain-containing protein n=1 Tax=Nannochloropsis salina CCMP1776 TaxID=1027361 RepID=A0A4D9D0I5_9STRA|nr:hypothetical protein NSK_005283 [Nannochloropsis salina CCMP1776]|eukprot:TFJ83443.1 hypothetical protein NSK_005283 [Nannochloropsis salina CCMP1776]
MAGTQAAASCLGPNLGITAQWMAAPISGVCVSATIWSLLFGIVQVLPIFKGRTFGYKTRVVAIFHAFTTMTLAYRLSFMCRPLEIGGINTPGQDIVVNVAGGFFLYDLISWIIYGYVIAKYDWMQLFHHASCLVGSWACWSSGRSGADVTFALFVAELANPFMYLRYLLREVGWKDTTLARTNQAIFALAMTLTIPILAPILACVILMEPKSHPLHQAAAVGLVVVNMMWFFKFMTKYWAAARTGPLKTGRKASPRKGSAALGGEIGGLIMSPSGAGTSELKED